ncbi:MAG TPA: halogenase [Nannocystis exedens]|nr:halogenase [Nannocystis exedens]
MKLYDVCIFGSGLGGTILGSILARHGIKTLLLDRSAHPRFAIGESTIPSTTGFLKILARRYDVPEIEALSSFSSIQKIAPSCGIKRAFTFFYHRRGHPQMPLEAMEYRTFPPPLGPDIHLLRSEVDTYMAEVAVRYGADLEERVEIREVEFGEVVRVVLADGSVRHAQFIVDGSGYNSVLAQKLGLRDPEPRLQTRSRVIFTHMRGVQPYDCIAAKRSAYRLTRTPFHQTTLHHVFDGGWIWVIPFDNHPRAIHQECSVGLCLDLGKFPARGLDAEQEFWQVVRAFPGIAGHFEGATATRQWVSTGRLQYTSSAVTGPRWCLLPHAASFVDPLFSSGLSLSIGAINLLAQELIDSTVKGELRSQRLDNYKTFLELSVNHYDRLIAGSYASWAHFELWNAWYRMWTIGAFLQVASELVHLARVVDLADASGFTQAPYRALQAIDYHPFEQLFEASRAELKAVREGDLPVDEAVARIFSHIRAAQLAPSSFTDIDSRSPITATLGNILRLLAWGRYQSTHELREFFFSDVYRIVPLLAGQLARAAWKERRSLRGLLRLTRDVVSTRNHEFVADGKNVHPLSPRCRKGRGASRS